MAFRIINVILANALLRLACLLPTANGFLAVNTVSSSAGVADVFLYSYSFPAVEVPTTATTVNCELSVPGLSYTLTRPGSVLQTTNGSQVECTFMDVRQRSLVRADLNLYDINDNALAVRSVWFGSPVLSTLKCSGYGLSSFRGYDDFGDLALVATDENIPFCTGTAGQRKTLSDDVWRGINGLYASNDLALMAKTQARFLDCYRTCGHTLDRKYFRSKRCQRFLLYSPTLLQITDSVNLYSGSVNSANPKHLSWSISQACLGLAPCFDKLVGSRLLQAYFSRNVTSDVGIPLVLFDSLVNEVPIFRDYVAFVAMGQKGQVNVFVDNDIYSIIPGTAFASILDALFLYNKAVTSINIRMQAQNPAVPATTNRCSQFNAMLETYLPTASVRACGTGRMTVPAWSCTEEGVANTFRSSRLVLSSYFAGSHLYVPTSYYPVMVDTDTSEAVPLILPRRRPEFRFAAPLSVTFPATDLRFRIPYTALTLQGSGQPLAASSVTPGSVAPVMTILPTTTYTRLVDPSATVLTTISGRLTTGTTELIANFPLATRGFTGETNVTLDIYFRLSYGSGGATIDGSTRLVIMLTAGPLPKHALTNITDASDSTKLFFTRMRASNASLFSNVTYDVTTYDVQGLPSILPFSKVASIHSIFNHSALTVLQNLPPDSTALGNVNSSYVFNPIRRHQLVYSTSVRDQLGIVITSLEDSINALNLKVLATSSFQSYALRSQFRWFAQEPSSAITRTDISKIDLPGVWLLQTNVGQIAIISVDWTESYSIYNNAHPVEFMLLVGLIEYIRLQRGCPVIVTGDFENEFRYMSTSTSYNTPGTSFASSWLRDLFQITSFPSANLDIAGSLWPLNVTYNNTMLRSLTATRPSSGNWYDHIW
ncbi:hypothetical protein DFJ77DRAFT_210197 [Powellomyces hirtus]|nr:hypothetical protein DFJ77DRAFT_210197 [Powellomyces hirtus]